jgi:hypothetical protein
MNLSPLRPFDALDPRARDPRFTRFDTLDPNARDPRFAWLPCLSGSCGVCKHCKIMARYGAVRSTL